MSCILQLEIVSNVQNKLANFLPATCRFGFIYLGISSSHCKRHSEKSFKSRVTSKMFFIERDVLFYEIGIVNLECFIFEKNFCDCKGLALICVLIIFS